MSHVLAVAPALPPDVYPQQQISDVIVPLLAPEGPRRRLAHRVHAASGVTTRHLALPIDEYEDLTSFGDANAHFVRVGTDLAEQACRAALADADVAPDEIDLVFFTSVTGIGAPSLDAALVHRLGLRPDVRRVPSFGLGCAGGAAGLAHLHEHLVGHRDRLALLVSVELCSLTFQRDDTSTANLVSSGLFGDGASAVVVAGDDVEPRSAAGPRLVGTRSHLYPGTAHALGWDVRDTGFGIVLSPELPDLLGAHLAGDVKDLLAPQGLTADDVGTWVVHAGGPKVVDAVRGALDLPESAVARTRATLAAEGNLSSSSVLHVLAATLADGEPAPGEWAVLMAFGPGVATELVLLRGREEAAA
ncbi:3-oxoacyl-[acyl-carrier-protein] synthase III C-terminal domain-containing protein [Isoptericola halotolerans]|uniref:Alkylresorcinol/alkylpyrone synthase n=1 Tax=Isoptericola halotolerans TaxID=300560 RepID=A0ABX1ZZY9_9MICO|nr:3-oxoacyl-[acyl-carrier-protein] synthase III C-terminal domain-containing protein [Isoptericola halotolerans]NOV96158.1 alkylresorcinol/alkylpyrone synthase [Isoptericola halotolerans]